MIQVTKLNQHQIIVNAEMIKFIEKTPDTMITLINGDHFMVLETMEEIVERAIDYARQIRSFNIV